MGLARRIVAGGRSQPSSRADLVGSGTSTPAPAASTTATRKRPGDMVAVGSSAKTTSASVFRGGAVAAQADALLCRRMMAKSSRTCRSGIAIACRSRQLKNVRVFASDLAPDLIAGDGDVALARFRTAAFQDNRFDAMTALPRDPQCPPDLDSAVRVAPAVVRRACRKGAIDPKRA